MDPLEKSVPVIFKRFALKPEGRASSASSPVSLALPVSSEAMPAKRERLSRYSTREIVERMRPVAKYFSREPWPEDWSIYWFASSLGGPGAHSREIRFLDMLLKSCNEDASLFGFTFFQQYLLYPHLVEWFTLNSLVLQPVPGIGIRPENGPARFPQQADVEGIKQDDALEVSKTKNQNMRLEDFFPYLPPPIHWLRGDQDLARHSMFGYGGWSIALSPLDQGKFFEAAKLILLENASESVKAFPVVAPILTPAYFISGSPALLESWFQTFDLFITESPETKGVVIASRKCLDEVLLSLVLESGLREPDPPEPDTAHQV